MGDSFQVGRGPCPDCGSSGGRMEYSDGHYYCFKCKESTYPDGESRGSQGGVNRESAGGRPMITDGMFHPLPTRGLDVATCRFWNYQIGRDHTNAWVQIANYKDQAGLVTGQKLRYADKKAGLPWRGSRPEGQLYGQWLWSSGGKKVVVCEGELDALSVSQVQGLKWPVVSLATGAQGAAQEFSHHKVMQWLDTFEQVILYFDDDGPGKEAVIECAKLFKPGKVFIASIPGYKDANEALMATETKADGDLEHIGPELIIKAIWNAKAYAPVELASLRECFIKPFTEPKEGASLPWPEMTRATGGLRPHEMTVIGAGIGVGKTTMCMEIASHVLQEHNWKIGVFPLEQTNDEYGCRLAGIMTNKKLWPKKKRSEGGAELWQLAQDTVEPYADQLQVFQREFVPDWTRMHHIIRHLAATGTDLIIIDNLTGLVSGSEMKGRKVDIIDTIFKELGAIAAAFPVHILVVSHLIRPERGQLTHERGREVEMADFRGSQSIGIFAHYCFGLERDKMQPAGTARLVMLKDRVEGVEATTPRMSLNFEENRLYSPGSKAKMLKNPVPPQPPVAKDPELSTVEELISPVENSANTSTDTSQTLREVNQVTNGRRYVFDTETNGVDFDGPNPTAEVEVIHCLVFKDIKSGEVYRANSNNPARLKQAIEHLNDADELIGQNIIQFDNPAIANLHPDFNPRGKLTDTKILSQILFPDMDPVDQDRWPWLFKLGLAGKHGLEAWGQRLGNPKDEYVKWCEENGIEDPWAKWSQRMEDYCVQDVDSTFTLYKFLVSEAQQPPNDPITVRKILDVEQEIAAIIHRQRCYGFAFNVEKAEKLYVELQAATQKIAADLRSKYVPTLMVNDGGKEKSYTKTMRRTCKVTGVKVEYTAGVPYRPVKVVDFNPGSSDHVAHLLVHKYGWVPTDGTLTPASQAIYKQLDLTPDDVLQHVKEKKLSVSGAEEILKALPYPFIDDVLHYQKQTKVASTVGGGEKSWLKLQRDGRIHGKVNPLGAATVRMTHSNPNVAGTPHVKVGDDGPLEGLDGGFGWECRGCFEASPGRMLVGCDAEGLELRMLGNYMAPYDGGAYAEAAIAGSKEDGTDVHSLAKAAIEYHDRNDTKTCEYAFLYGGGDVKLGVITFKQFTEEQAKDFGEPTPAKLKNLGADIRAKLIGGFPGLDKLVDELAQAFERGWLRALDGRILRPRKEHSILNMLLQSGGAIAMKHGLILLDRQLRKQGFVSGVDYEFVANIHDEWQIETLPEHAERIAPIAAEAIKMAGVRLRMHVPLAGDSQIGRTWAETH